MGMMRAVAFQDTRKLELVEREIPAPAPGQVVMQSEYCGICGSDLHLYQHGLLPQGAIMGHEVAGRIVAVGSGVTHLKEGDRVVNSSTHFCGQCKFCRAGLHGQCPDVIGIGLGQWDGGYAEFVRMMPGMLSALPDSLPTSTAALLDPVSTAYHAIVRGGGVTGRICFVMGLGPIGLALCTMLRFCGARLIVASEYVEARRLLGQQMGADMVFDPREHAPEDTLSELTDGLGPEVVFEVVGVPGTMNEAILLCRPHGTMVLVGVCMEPESVVNALWALREIRVITTMGYTQAELEMNRDLIVAGKIDPTPMITEHIDLAEVPAAFQRLGTPNNEAKILIDYVN